MEDHDRLTPLYEQVRRAILAEIETGSLPVGSFLPPEPELCAAYNVSRITLRRAISELCAAGRLVRQQGRGTLVLPEKVRQTLVSLSGFSETMDGIGRRATHRVLGREDGAHDPAIRDRLAASSLVRFDRLIEVDGHPMTLEALWFDAARFPQVVAAVATGGSFFAALRDLAGLAPAGAERQIDVSFATSDERAVLNVTSSQPVYRIEKLVFDTAGAALAFSKLVTPCHLVTFTVRN